LEPRFALASSQREDPAEALAEAADEVRRALGETPAFAVVVATPDRLADPNRFEQGLAAALGAVPHAGGGAARLGVGDESHVAKTIAILACAGPVRARAFAAPPPSEARELDLASALDALSGNVGTVVAFADPRGPQGPLLPRLLEQMAPGAAVAGGGSTGRELFQVCQGKVLRGSCAGLAVELVAARAGVFVAQGGALVGPRARVTRCEGGRILELDGRPAAWLLEALRNEELGASLEAVAARLAMALAPDGPAALEDGRWIVRNLGGVDPKTRSVQVAARIEEGWGVSLVLREAIAAREQVRRQARRLAEVLGPASPTGGLYFDCASRGEALYGFDGVDEAQVRKALGTFPMLTIQSSFELGPLFESARARPELQLYSGVFWGLSTV
jgi:small ligand-binding sensory domain FIST